MHMPLIAGHMIEGYGLAWRPLLEGHQLSGSNDANFCSALTLLLAARILPERGVSSAGHEMEGYGLAWSPLLTEHLLSGSRDADICKLVKEAAICWPQASYS